jgi:hypothetical protein
LLPDSAIAPSQTRLQDGIKKSKQYTNDIVRYAYFANYVVSYTMQEALAVPQWKEVINDEYNALQCNKTWTLVPP